MNSATGRPGAVSRLTVLSPDASFWAAAAVVAHTLWTSAAPAMTYPLYAAEWHLTFTITTAIFALYPVTVVAVLIGFGDISDYVGRRTAMLWGLLASLIGVLCFAVAPDVGWVAVGRVFMGLGVGLSAGPASAAMLEFGSPALVKRASSVNAAAQALGLACAVVLGGALIQYAPFPTRLNFCLLAVVLAVLITATYFLPRHTRSEIKARWTPKMPSVPRGLRLFYLASVLGVGTAYAQGPIMLSLGSQIARELIGSSNILVNGLVIGLFAAVMGGTSIACRGLAPRTAMMAGGMLAVLGMCLLALAASRHDLFVFIAAAIILGMSYSLTFMGGLGLISARAPAHHRGGVISAIYLVGYVLQGGIALLLGYVATAHGLELAIDLGCAIIAVLGAMTIALASLFSRTSAPAI